MYNKLTFKINHFKISCDVVIDYSVNDLEYKINKAKRALIFNKRISKLNTHNRFGLSLL